MAAKDPKNGFSKVASIEPGVDGKSYIRTDMADVNEALAILAADDFVFDRMIHDQVMVIGLVNVKDQSHAVVVGHRGNGPVMTPGGDVITQSFVIVIPDGTTEEPPRIPLADFIAARRNPPPAPVPRP